LTPGSFDATVARGYGKFFGRELGIPGVNGNSSDMQAKNFFNSDTLPLVYGFPAAVRYFSTHPATAGRTAAMRAMAESAAYAPRRLLARAAWPPPFAGCRQPAR
jgi:hypothetical protein